MRPAFGRLKTRIATGVGSTVAVCMATAYTIFGVGSVAPVTQYQAGQTIEAGRWLVVPHRAWVSHEKRVYDVRVEPGQQALVVEVDLNNRTASSTRGDTDTLRPHWPEGVSPNDPDVAVLRDPKVFALLHPGMRERVAYVWVLPDAVTLPDKLPIDVVAKSYKRVDNLYGTPGWFNPKVIGQFTLPVETNATSVNSVQVTQKAMQADQRSGEANLASYQASQALGKANLASLQASQASSKAKLASYQASQASSKAKQMSNHANPANQASNNEEPTS